MTRFFSRIWGIPDELYKPMPRKGHFLFWGMVWTLTGVGLMLLPAFVDDIITAQVLFVLGLLVMAFMGVPGLCMYHCHALIVESRFRERMREREENVPWH